MQPTRFASLLLFMEVFYMDRPNTLFEAEQLMLQTFVESPSLQFSHIFYKRNAERLALHFPNLNFENRGSTEKCRKGQHLYTITKK